MSQLAEHCSSPRAKHGCVSSDLQKKARLIEYFPPKQAALFLSFRVYSVASHLMYTLAKGLFVWTFSRVSVQMMNLQTFQIKGSGRCICRPSSPPSVYPTSIFLAQLTTVSVVLEPMQIVKRVLKLQIPNLAGLNERSSLLTQTAAWFTLKYEYE